MIGTVWWLIPAAQAAVWTVKTDGSGQYTSIQAAINAASSGDTIEVGPGVWSEAISTTNKRLTLRSTGGSSATTLDATGRGDDAVQAWGDLTLEGFTIANRAGRGLGIWGGQAHLSDLVFDAIGTEWSSGSAMYVNGGAVVDAVDVSIDGGMAYQGMIYASGATLSFSNLSVDGSEAAANGAALMAYSSTIEIEGGMLQRLYAVYNGGAMFVSSSTLTLRDVDVYGNLTDYGHGTGLYAESSTITVEGGSFELNNSIHYDSGYHGGAMYLAGSSALLDGVELVDNYAYYGGAILSTESTVSVLGGSLARNWGYYGGAIYANGTNNLFLEGGSVSSNTGYYGGGGLYQTGSYTLDVAQTVFTENEATYGHGGAVYTYYYGNAAFTDTVFEDNYAYYNGAGVFSYYTYGTDTYQGCTFEGNTSVYGDGAALSPTAYVTVTVTDARFAYNETTYGNGGAIYAYYAPLSIVDSEIIGNRAAEGVGGGLYSYYAWGHNSGALQVERVLFQSNSAYYQGGAIATVSDDVRITDSTFTTNDVDLSGMGGGIYVSNTLRAALRRNLFVGNNAGYGGAVYGNQASRSVGTEQWSNNIFQENTAATGGGAVWVYSPEVQLRNNVFVGNSAIEGAGNIALVESTLIGISNIFAHSTAGVALHAYDKLSATGSRLAHNVFYDITDGLIGGAFTEDVVLADGGLQTDPLFAAYSPDGVAENDHYVLLRDSPLIDAGDSLLTDPDGSPSDIGVWGGPDVVVQDADKDGYDNWIDCDEVESGAHPGGVEVFYDGINQDCLSGSDFDADRDGHDADTHGGDDCDDSDPALVSDCPAADTGDPSDTGAPDGDTPVDPAQGGGKGTGCAHSPAPAQAGGWARWGALVVGLAGITRRRRLSLG